MQGRISNGKNEIAIRMIGSLILLLLPTTTGGYSGGMDDHRADRNRQQIAIYLMRNLTRVLRIGGRNIKSALLIDLNHHRPWCTASTLSQDINVGPREK